MNTSLTSHFLVDHSTNSSLFQNRYPILSTSDYNGDGIVNRKDLRMVVFGAIKGKFGQYDAIFDRNADGKVDRHDIKATIADFGKQSSLLDQQLGDLYQETQKYYSQVGMLNVLLDGYTAFTPVFQGHGEHWVNVDRVANALSKPSEELTHRDYIGLNIEPSEDGGYFERDVLGVFYLIQPDNVQEQFRNFVTSAYDGDDKINFGIPDYSKTPDLFADDPLVSPHRENLHQHNSVYIHYPNPIDPTSVIFEQNLTPHELYERFVAATESDPNNEKVIWGIETANGFNYSDIRDANVLFLPSFQMMHAWVNSINPGEDGIFGETNPLVSPNAPPLPSGHHDSSHMMLA